MFFVLTHVAYNLVDRSVNETVGPALPLGTAVLGGLVLAAVPFWKRVKLASNAARDSWKETAR